MKQYLNLIGDLLEQGQPKADRTGTGTLSVFGRQFRHDLKSGFPLLTTKKLHFKSIATELQWFLEGRTFTDWLNMRGVTIWNEWADDNGNLGPIYGRQWTAWPTTDGKQVDQIADLISGIKTNPFSRRHVFSAWNPEWLPLNGKSPQENVALGRMALAPCHVLYQFYVDNNWRLSSQVYLRSSDIFLGLPYNIASLALLTHWMAKLCYLDLGDIVVSIGDLHLYSNHIPQAKQQLLREAKYLPILKVNQAEYKPLVMDYSLENYDPHPHIKADIAI